MKRLVTKAVLGLAFATSHAFSQTPDPMGFFPHATGDMWEYFWVEPGFPDTLQSFMVQDSAGIDGRIHATKDSRWIDPETHFWTDRYVIDTARNQVLTYLESGSQLVVQYKLDAVLGEQWVMVDRGGGPYEMCRVASVRPATVLGIPTTIKDYRYYAAADSTDTLGLSRGGHVLASGFGLIYVGGGDLFYEIYMKGTVINGTLYGDTTHVTSVPDVSPHLPTQFELSPNYPNPFNPSTTIRFKVYASGRITLIVYDLLGHEIRRLIDDERFDPGDREITWDGRANFSQEASSGVYYYRLFGNGNSITRSMMLLK